MRNVRMALCLAAAALLGLLLGGCVQLDVQAGIDPDCTAFLYYELQVDTAGFTDDEAANIRTALKDLGEHYKNSLGFGANLRRQGTTQLLQLEKQVLCNSWPQAFAALEQMLTDETMSLFMTVAMDDTVTAHQQVYRLTASLDISKVASLSTIGQFPPSTQQRYAQAAAGGTGTVTLSLPASFVENASHAFVLEDHIVTMALPLAFDGETHLELVTRLYTDGTEWYDQPLEEMIASQRTRGLLFTLLAAAGGLLLLLATLLLVLGRKKSRANMPPPDAAAPPTQDAEQ